MTRSPEATSRASPAGGRFLLSLALLVLLQLSNAHGELVSSEPADRAVLESLGGEATLTFSEPVEVPFSTVKVYRLDTPLPEVEPGDRGWLRVNGLAGALVAHALADPDANDGRIDSGLITSERRSERLAVGLPEELEPGVYVLMWRVLSIDTHVVEGFVTFIVAPGG